MIKLLDSVDDSIFTTVSDDIKSKGHKETIHELTYGEMDQFNKFISSFYVVMKEYKKFHFDDKNMIILMQTFDTLFPKTLNLIRCFRFNELSDRDVGYLVGNAIGLYDSLVSKYRNSESCHECESGCDGQCGCDN